MTYHFVGIKGAGMSALAQIIFDLGYKVQGSDKEDYFFTQDKLVERNIPLYSYSEKNIKEELIIIQGNSISDEHEEIIKANELHLKIYTYQDMLKKLTKMYKTITIAGCHGKTTTTSMLSHVVNNIKGCNYLIGDATGYAEKENEYFVLEACEYKRHFLNYLPYYAVITNIDLDHTDYFKNIDDVISAYQEYVKLAEKMVILCGDDPYTHLLESNVPMFYYGLNEDNDIIAKDVEYTTTGTSFDVFVEENYYGHFELPIFGKHMLLNALAVIGICYYERLEVKDVVKHFKTFEGAKRRYAETVVGTNVLVDDYAHHPTEVKATIKTTKQKYPDKKIVAVFQPHTYSRTEEFKDDFIEVFETIDYSYILDIHPSREKQEDFPNITNKIITSELKNSETITVDNIDKLLKWENTILLFMSPNDLSDIENKYIASKND